MKTKIETNEDYHKSQNISASGLKSIYKKSVYHFLNQKPFTSSALSLGSAVHVAMLEPEKFNDEFYVFPKIDRRTKEGKQDYKNHSTKAEKKELISESDLFTIESIKEKLKFHSLAKEYCEGKIELSHYGEMDSVPIRVRPDCKGVDWISDVKSCQDNSPLAFKRDIYKWSYHLQATFYSDALGYPAENFRFIAVETNHPFTIEVYKMNEDMIEQGRKGYKDALANWKLYLDTGVQTGYKGYEYAKDGAIII